MEPLPLVAALLEALDAADVVYCHWKSNEAIDRTLTAENDLDLLVARRDGTRFNAAVHALGFRIARPSPDRQVPGLVDYFGRDEGTGRMVHVQAHFQLVLGDDMTKNFRLPLEDAYLASRFLDGPVAVPNRPFELLAAMIGEDVWARVGGAERNLMRLFFHPAGVKPLIANWAAIAPLLWQRARREADALGGEEMQAVLADLGQYQDVDTLRPAEDAALVPVLPLEMEKDGLRVSLFTVIATFGTAQDVTADELRIESFFAADEATEALFRQAAS